MSAIIGPLNLLESIVLVISTMFLKYSDQNLMSSVLKIFYHLLPVSAIPQEHKKMESDLLMEYEVSMLHLPTKNKGRYNFKYSEFSY